MSNINELQTELSDLKKKFEATRNPSERSKYVDRINAIEKELNSKKLEKKVFSNNDVPIRADHQDRKISRGDIVNTGNTFTTIL